MNTSPISESGSWSLGTLIGLPVGIIVTVAFLAAGAYLIRTSRRNDAFDPGEMLVFGGTSTLIGAVILGLLLSPLGMYPYDSEYHQWREVSGTVERIESRQIADGNGMSERYVFVIAGQPFGIDDSRAAVAEEGDTVTLRCKREWQYASESGWGCRWGGKA